MAGTSGELVVIAGLLRGQRVPLRRDTLRIGRDRGCEIRIVDEAASRVHSEIVCVGGAFVLRDLKSTNGTFLNDARVNEAPLHNGDRVSVGDTIMLVQLHEAREHAPALIFSPDLRKATTSLALNLEDTAFLELRAGTPLADAQRQFQQLHGFMASVAGVLHLPALLERALDYFCEVFAADRGVILLHAPDGEPGLKITRMRAGLIGAGEIAISRTMVQQLLHNKESFLSTDTHRDERLAHAESIHQMHAVSIMGSPLKLNDKVSGMVYLDVLAPERAFSELNLKLCTAMALQLAVCVENARLYTELLNAAEFNHAVLRAMSSGLLVLDQTGKILRCNRATQEILGKSDTQLLGHALSEFPELSDLRQAIENTLTSGVGGDRSEILLRGDGAVVPLGLSTSLLRDHSGAVIGVVANFRNLAALRKLEEQVRRSQHLAALGQMAAGVAHEIRNPLNSIRGFTQLVQEGAAKDPPAFEYTQIVLEEVDRMNRIVQDLLDFSRQREMTLAPVPIPLLVEDLLNEMRMEAEDMQIELALLPPVPGLPEVLGNADKLRQVFRNIVLNALQACQPGGRVTVGLALSESEAAEPSGEQEAGKEGREIAVSVTDNGSGIPADVMLRIFDPFFTQKEQGTGLGLSISQKIAEQHNGRIDVKSETGKGSTFTVYLPAAT